MKRPGRAGKTTVGRDMAPALRGLTFLALPLLMILGALAVWWPPLDTINQFTPMLFLACMAVLVFGTRQVDGFWRASVLSACIVALYISGTNLLGERFGGLRDIHGPCPDQTVTVLTQNLWSRNQEPWRTADTLKRSGADVLLLQEVRGSGEEVVRLLRPSFPYAADCSTNPWCSLTILSKKPIRTWRYHQGRWTGPDPDVLTFIIADIDSGVGAPMTVVTTHLLHLSDHELQSRQMRQLVTALADEDQADLVVGGDMNLTPWTFALKSLDSHMQGRRVSRNVPSWPARAPFPDYALPSPFPLWPIDHIYAGKNWRACKVGASRRTGSDHYGVIATFAPVEITASKAVRHVAPAH